MVLKNILFKGKNKRTGEWVVGDIVRTETAVYIHPIGNIFVDNGTSKYIVLKEVVPESVVVCINKEL